MGREREYDLDVGEITSKPNVSVRAGDPFELPRGKRNFYTPKNDTGPVPKTPGMDGTFDPIRIKPGSNLTQFKGQDFQQNLLNPYGLGLPDEFYGKTPVFGGNRDLLKSIAARGTAISGLMEQLRPQGAPDGLANAMQSYAGATGDPLSAEAYSNFSPTMDRQALIADDSRRAGLSGLMSNAYVLGGGLFGGAKKGWAQAKQMDMARREKKAALNQAIVGGVLKGLGVYDMYGIGDISTGATGEISK